MQLDVRHRIALGPGHGENAGTTSQIKAEHPLLDVIEIRLAPGQRGPEPHIHKQHADGFYVLEGEVVFRVGAEGREICGQPGAVLVAPPGLVHSFHNGDSLEARLLNLHAPSRGFAESLRARRHPSTYDATQFDTFQPPDDGGRALADVVLSDQGEGESLHGDHRELRVKARLPTLTLLEFHVDAGYEGPGPHFHKRHVDAFYVLGGELEFRLGGDGGAETVRAPSGAFVAAPPHVVHAFTNPGPGRAHFLNVHAPESGFVDYLRARARDEEVDPAQFDIWEVEE